MLPVDSLGDVKWSYASNSSLTSVDQVQTTLKNMIHRGELAPGDRLPAERRLCALLQVSRSTLREALNALRADGYIEVYRSGPTGGSFISHLDVAYGRWLAWMQADSSRLREIMHLRTAIECQIAWLAAENSQALDEPSVILPAHRSNMSQKEFREADGRFHAALADAAGSPRLKSLMLEARGELFVPASSSLINTSMIDRSHREHEIIMDAVQASNPGAAAEAMRAHLASTYDDVSSALNLPEAL